METKRKELTLRLKPETRALLDEMYKSAGSRSRSDFIEKAIEFYCGYLSSENDQSFLPGAVVSALQGTVSQLERGVCLQLHKIAVELYAMENLMVAVSGENITLDQIHKLRKRANTAVREHGGMLSLVEAYRYQNGED